MQNPNTLQFIDKVLNNMPNDWLNLTTHRLDIYNEELAKTEFIEAFENLFNTNEASKSALANLPTAYDYIRLGHPLSCVLEWAIAKLQQLETKQVISFSSQTTPILAVLRANLLSNTSTQILYTDALPKGFNAETIKTVYGYDFELKKINASDAIPVFDGSTILVSKHSKFKTEALQTNIDFHVNLYDGLGSCILINSEYNDAYISEIQHVRRRETIAMTPANCHVALQAMVKNNTIETIKTNKTNVLNTIKAITQTTSQPLVASSGLSMQYAIMMGLINAATETHPNKPITFIVPTNCYGGTNDQARRVAACLKQVSVVDLQVDGDNDMVSSLETVLKEVAQQDAVPYIIAEIPTNPRVEVPDLEALKTVLAAERTTKNNKTAIAPVFILDQTFCPNVPFLNDDSLLSAIKTIAYVSGSKFPSGGKCTAGYCASNQKARHFIPKIEQHLSLCDNEATALQYDILATQMPSMLQRITDAYKNTRHFVSYIESVLPEAKINFVTEALAEQDFTPSVFSLDLPTKGNTHDEREAYKRALNLKLINMMISEIPSESKYCVSYGQLKGCYWTIPATSTQGTTKEGDKDYIARVAVSPDLDLEQHKAVFKAFVDGI